MSNHHYNPLRLGPSGDDDITIERFVRDKYEMKRFMGRETTGSSTHKKPVLEVDGSVGGAGESGELNKYQRGLDLLKDMGFVDRQRNIRILNSVTGDIASAAGILIAMESTDGKDPPPKPSRPKVRSKNELRRCGSDAVVLLQILKAENLVQTFSHITTPLLDTPRITFLSCAISILLKSIFARRQMHFLHLTNKDGDSRILEIFRRLQLS